MNILHYINNLGSGGAEKLLTDILPEFKKNDHKIFVLIANSDKNFEKYEEILKAAQIEVHELGTSFYNPLQVFNLVKFIKNNNIEIVHAHLFPTQYWLAAASLFIPKGIKLLKTEHNAHNSRRKYKLLCSVEKLIYSRYSLTIAITQKVKENLKTWIGDSCPIIIIKNGVNLNQIETEIIKGTTLELENARFNILMVGSFDGRQKDQLSLIKALAYLPNDISIYFAGKGRAIEDVKKEVTRLGFTAQVTFLELRRDVYALMNSVDLNVLSTNYEGLSGVALEAMASGKPFIGSDVEGVQEVVPSKLFLFPARDPKALAARILEIKTNPETAQQMVNESKNYIKSYDTAVMVSDYLDVYQDLITSNGNFSAKVH